MVHLEGNFLSFFPKGVSCYKSDTALHFKTLSCSRNGCRKNPHHLQPLTKVTKRAVLPNYCTHKLGSAVHAGIGAMDVIPIRAHLLYVSADTHANGRGRSWKMLSAKQVGCMLIFLFAWNAEKARIVYPCNGGAVFQRNDICENIFPLYKVSTLSLTHL